MLAEHQCGAQLLFHQNCASLQNFHAGYMHAPSSVPCYFLFISSFSMRTALDELFGPLRRVFAGAKFNAFLQQVMETLPDRYTLRDLRLSRGLACE
ncbi:unnamed protein product, partial [Effrenium voratum]